MKKHFFDYDDGDMASFLSNNMAMDIIDSGESHMASTWSNEGEND